MAGRDGLDRSGREGEVFCVIVCLSVCYESNRGPGGLVAFGKCCVRESYVKRQRLPRVLRRVLRRVL